jgi:broad specificity phosphatase PhoE
MHIVLIRHGESTGNIGLSCSDISQVELTERGRQQARHLANTWTETPTLIVVSPILRTQQTAQPTSDRFPAVPVEEWRGIEEFTYLEPSRWNGSVYSERLPVIEAYWKAEDPKYCDGPGAESFSTLLRRAETALERLQALIGHPTVFLFSHGQFMQAVRITVLYSETSDKEKMRLFFENEACAPFQNAELFRLNIDEMSGTRLDESTEGALREDIDADPVRTASLLNRAEEISTRVTNVDRNRIYGMWKRGQDELVLPEDRFNLAETQNGHPSNQITAFSEGMTRQEALLSFQSSVNRSDTIFSTDHWLFPKLAELAALLKDPISADQAHALDDVLRGRHFMKELINWLKLSRVPWVDYFEDLKVQQTRREALKREQRAAWGEAQRKKWTVCVRLTPSFFDPKNVVNCLHD